MTVWAKDKPTFTSETVAHRMGKKNKKAGDAADVPVWIPKKPKISADEPLSHLNALMQVRYFPAHFFL